MPEERQTPTKGRSRLPIAAGAVGGGLLGLAGLARHYFDQNPVNDALPGLTQDLAARTLEGSTPADRISGYLDMGQLLNERAVGGATGMDVMQWLREPGLANLRPVSRLAPNFGTDWGQPWGSWGSPDPEHLTRKIDDHYRNFASGPAGGLEQLAWEHLRPGTRWAEMAGADDAQVRKSLQGLADVPDQKARVAAYFATPEGKNVAGALDAMGVPSAARGYKGLVDAAIPAIGAVQTGLPATLAATGGGLIAFSTGQGLRRGLIRSDPTKTAGEAVTRDLPIDDGDLLLAIFCPAKAAFVEPPPTFDVPPPPAPAGQPGLLHQVLGWARNNPWTAGIGAAGLGAAAGAGVAATARPKKPRQDVVHPNTAPADDADDVGEGQKQGAAPGPVVDGPPGPQQATNAAKAYGLEYPFAAGHLAGAQYSDANMPVRGGWARRHGALAGGEQLRQGTKYVSPTMRWGGELLPEELALVLGTADRGAEAYAAHILPHSDVSGADGAQPFDSALYDRAKALTPRTFMNAADVLARDANVAAHRYNRTTHPGHYYLNPFVRSGPLHEMFDRVLRRAAAEKADPDAAARWSLYVPGVPTARGFLGGRNAEKQDKARTLAHTAYVEAIDPDTAAAARDMEKKDTEKKADEPAPGLGAQIMDGAGKLWDAGKAQGQEIANHAATQAVGNKLNEWGAQAKDFVNSTPWASNALYYGAPIGAGLGLLGGLTSRKRDKWKAVGDAVTGGLLGGLGGAAVGGVQSMFGSEPPKGVQPANVQLTKPGPTLQGINSAAAVPVGVPLTAAQSVNTTAGRPGPEARALSDVQKLFGQPGRLDLGVQEPTIRGIEQADPALAKQIARDVGDYGNAYQTQAATLGDRGLVGGFTGPDRRYLAENGGQEVASPEAIAKAQQDVRHRYENVVRSFDQALRPPSRMPADTNLTDWTQPSRERFGGVPQLQAALAGGLNPLSPMGLAGAVPAVTQQADTARDAVVNKYEKFLADQAANAATGADPSGAATNVDTGTIGGRGARAFAQGFGGTAAGIQGARVAGRELANLGTKNPDAAARAALAKLDADPAGKVGDLARGRVLADSPAAVDRLTAGTNAAALTGKDRVTSDQVRDVLSGGKALPANVAAGLKVTDPLAGLAGNPRAIDNMVLHLHNNGLPGADTVQVTDLLRQAQAGTPLRGPAADALFGPNGYGRTVYLPGYTLGADRHLVPTGTGGTKGLYEAAGLRMPLALTHPTVKDRLLGGTGKSLFGRWNLPLNIAGGVAAASGSRTPYEQVTGHTGGPSDDPAVLELLRRLQPEVLHGGRP